MAKHADRQKQTKIALHVLGIFFHKPTNTLSDFCNPSLYALKKAIYS